MGSRNESKDPPRIEGMVSLKVDNISPRAGPNELRELFCKFGDIGDVHVPKDKWSGENRGFGFVRFFSSRDAEDALDRMDGKTIHGRELRVTMARYGRPCDERGKRRNQDHNEIRRSRRSRSRSRPRSPSKSRRRSRSRSNSRRRTDHRQRSSSGGDRHRRRRSTPRRQHRSSTSSASSHHSSRGSRSPRGGGKRTEPAIVDKAVDGKSPPPPSIVQGEGAASPKNGRSRSASVDEN